MIKKLVIVISFIIISSAAHIFTSTISVLNLAGNIPLSLSLTIAHLDSSYWSGNITKHLDMNAPDEWQDIARLRDQANFRYRVIVNTTNDFKMVGDNHAYELEYQLRVIKLEGQGPSPIHILTENGDSYDRDFQGQGKVIKTMIRSLEIRYDAESASLVPDIYRDTVVFTIQAN